MIRVAENFYSYPAKPQQDLFQLLGDMQNKLSTHVSLYLVYKYAPTKIMVERIALLLHI
jgi:hypothetical protein